jgi:haloacetate dehalogenase
VYDGFERVQAETGEATINAVHAGSRPPVLLLHGFPQTSAMRHQVAPALTRQHTVVAADLRGNGAFGRPPSVTTTRAIRSARGRPTRWS